MANADALDYFVPGVSIMFTKCFYVFCWFPQDNSDFCSAGITFGLFYQVPFRDFLAGVAERSLRICPSPIMSSFHGGTPGFSMGSFVNIAY